MAYQAAVTAPHFLAAQSGEKILKSGGNAIEACIAMASTLSVVYPHMTNPGGDGFWLIHKPGEMPVGLNAAGHAAANLDGVEFGDHLRGPKVALTTAGAVSGWNEALIRYPGQLTLSQLLSPAIDLARNGFPVSESLHNALIKLAVDYPSKDFSKVFFNGSKPYETGDIMKLPAIANTFRDLSERGFSDWSSGELAKKNADYLYKQGSPITIRDLEKTKAFWCEALELETIWGKFYNMGAPTQGGSSLNIIGILNQLVTTTTKPKSFWLTQQGEQLALHTLIEAVKIAFNWRNEQLSDSTDCDGDIKLRLNATQLNEQFTSISEQAQAWPNPGPTGDTVWMGAVDKNGLAVSYIQSIYWEFGSGLVNPETGVVWNNRCLGFNNNPEHPNSIKPGHQPMHTLNPPLAILDDNSRLIYGTMGGEGQPQTQAAIIWRYLLQEFSLSNAIAAPRWLLGKTWGKSQDNLKLEQSLYERLGTKLLEQGHDAVAAADFAEFFGHAGAIHIKDNDSTAATDPRSDGAAIVIK
ncbi:gamma-glutamyltransferase [Alginatibacterium sediminis]|uniref:Gamma-glutamyltransferase n=1 Tax=Alginatibacterium sediminis TaxID=2164068 RepID=A0A420EGU7_9ALTE|nr:gamma-glutamyltransferase [Alginatibacterium sediminis]RKF19898.1 gamma-glutamyltransferase [Alginatibacterium sediminis]